MKTGYSMVSAASLFRPLSLALLAVVVSVFPVQADDRTAIEDRIRPVGKVCLQDGTNCPAGAPVAAADASAAGASAARSGADIFKTTCSGCHATGAAGAPKVGDKAAWAPRIAQGKDTLYTHALGGFNAMPPKGMCGNCSDDEIRATVDYMTGESR